MKKNKDFDKKVKKEVYGEIFRLSVNPKILVGGHLMVEFEKEQDYRSVGKGLKSKKHKDFGTNNS